MHVGHGTHARSIACRGAAPRAAAQPAPPPPCRSDTVCCLYGEPGGYGVVTKIASVRNGINNFLAGYIPAENMRFRAEELSFHVSGAEAADQIANEAGAGKGRLGDVSYPGAWHV